MTWCVEEFETYKDGSGSSTSWTWGDPNKSLWISISSSGDVFIDRRTDNVDRADCTSGPTTNPLAPKDQAFIDDLGTMKGWPDRASVIAAKRDDLIEMGLDACAIQEQDGGGLIATSASVVDIYGVSGDEAGAVVVAAFDVYCPEAGS
jgi:hypothetical protein